MNNPAHQYIVQCHSDSQCSFGKLITQSSYKKRQALYVLILPVLDIKDDVLWLNRIMYILVTFSKDFPKTPFTRVRLSNTNDRICMLRSHEYVRI